MDGVEEVRKMKAVWQQIYTEAEREGRVIPSVVRRAPAGADAGVRVEEEEEEEEEKGDVEIKNEVSFIKIKFSLLNLKK